MKIHSSALAGAVSCRRCVYARGGHPRARCPAPPALSLRSPGSHGRAGLGKALWVRSRSPWRGQPCRLCRAVAVRGQWGHGDGQHFGGVSILTALRPRWVLWEPVVADC